MKPFTRLNPMHPAVSTIVPFGRWRGHMIAEVPFDDLMRLWACLGVAVWRHRPLA